MKVKELDKTVNVAWSPAAQHPIVLAAGTAAQQLDASFSTSSTLELHGLNLGEPGLEMQLLASAPSDQRFHKVVWGNNGAIVGGCDGGLVQIYNSQKLMSGEKAPSARQDKHSGPVRALDFNPFQSNLLATGASESEIYIWDLNNISTPMTPGAKAQPLEDVAWISWNRQVQHILASSFAQRCVVWDLRKNEPIIKLSDSQLRTRWKVVSWHPDVATQLSLASEEDSAPIIQLWDLRFATSPIRTLENHQRGVLSIAWCMQDPDLLLSCGKDNRILCWNPNSNTPGGEVVCEVATTTQWNFDVAWCPRNPALISSCSFDGHVNIYSLTGGAQPQMQTSNKIADSFPGMESYVQATPPQQAPVSVDLRKPPKWLRRPCGASFGFGGKLVSFEFDKSAPVQQHTAPQQPGFVSPPAVKRTVSVCQVVTEGSLMARAQALDVALQQGDYREFCKSRSANCRTSHERTLWECLRAHFEPNLSSEVLTLLDFNPEEVKNKLNTAIARHEDSPAEVNGFRQCNKSDAQFGSADDAFNAIASTEEFKKKPDGIAPFKIVTGNDPVGLICQALLLGHTEAAVELCLQEGRHADAIVLAMTGGPDLLAKTQFRYFQKSTGYLSTLMSAVVTEDWSQVVASCDLESWKEALTAILTHTRGDEFSRLCEKLGHRLEVEAGGIHKQKAQLCYAIAGNLHKLVDNWMSAIRPTTPEQMQDLVEIVAVLRTAMELRGNNVDISGSLANTLSQYAEFLASQGSLVSAFTYLTNSQDEKLNELRERLSVALGYKPLRSQQADPRRPSMPNQRALHSTSNRQAPYFYNQTQAAQPFAPAPASFPAAPYNSSPLVPAPVPAPMSAPIPAPIPAPVPMQTLPPSQPLSGVPPLQVQPSMPGPPPGPSASPGLLPRAPSVTGGSSSRKYVLDPSVQSGTAGYNPSSNFSSPGSMFNQPPSQNQPQLYATQPQGQAYPGQPQSQPFSGQPQTQPFTSQPANPQFSSYGSSAYGETQQDFFKPSPLPAPPTSQPPPGWNDPPAVTNAVRAKPPKTDAAAVAPITHPLFGAVPQETAPPLNSLNGGYADPMMGNVGAYGHVQQNVYQAPNVYQPQIMQAQMINPNEQAPPAPQFSRAKPEPPPPKAPIPEEHIVLQTVFNDLRNRCFQASNNPQAKRKLDDVARKLDVLYDALRDMRLSNNTLQSLHQLVQMVQMGDYAGGLNLHTQLVSGPDFSQISSFMPGLKVLLQTALSLGVYLQ
ncbi:Protein transport protein Sec31A [Frankliniella fusca]|uniref:Protein transport protein Sec31A n=1 Tax=Frankliniella fusca TaxID=407009 RepID=A0AAE1H5R5_9NEOP|nr:Protein transport protein Sec31A [Frankliniella fusca]